MFRLFCIKCGARKCNETIHPHHLLLSKQVQGPHERGALSPWDSLSSACVAGVACGAGETRGALSEARWLCPRPGSSQSVSGPSGEGWPGPGWQRRRVTWTWGVGLVQPDGEVEMRRALPPLSGPTFACTRSSSSSIDTFLCLRPVTL